jgi:predicted RNase H-like HicB family nuclease
MRKYVVLFEQGPTNWSAYAPSLPGVIATGKTKEELLKTMSEAIQFHLEGMLRDGDPIPEEEFQATLLDVPEPVIA